jgi:uncharacterized membrane protein
MRLNPHALLLTGFIVALLAYTTQHEKPGSAVEAGWWSLFLAELGL